MKIRLLHKHKPEKIDLVYEDYEVYSCSCGEFFSSYINLLNPIASGWLLFSKGPKVEIQALINS